MAQARGIGREEEEEEEEEDSLGQISNETLFTSCSSDAQTAAAAAFCTYFNFHHEYIDTGLHSAHRHSLYVYVHSAHFAFPTNVKVVVVRFFSQTFGL